MRNREGILVGRVRMWLLIFVAGLVVSGATAIPLAAELRVLAGLIGADNANSGIAGWIVKVRNGLVQTNTKYPFMAYGTDWLAFAHFIIAILFIGPMRDPVKNVWVIEFDLNSRANQSTRDAMRINAGAASQL